MSTEKILWGSYDGKDCYLVTLKNKNMTASFTSYGGAIVNLLVPDKNGNVADVVLGYDDLDGYVNGGSCQGALVGRYANRISGAMVTIDGIEYPLDANEGENQLNVSKELVQMVGYYVTQQDLETDIAAIRPQLQKLEKSTPVMIDVKSYKGDFFYSSTLSDNRNSKIDPAAMDELLEYLQLSDMYAIARLPGLRDFNYGLNHVSDGLPTAGGYLLVDDDRCYWLNPSSQGTITYLVSIITELKSLGFDEVVFEDFRFPDTTQIVFKNDRAEALTAAAQLLVDTCTGDNFAVSFVGAHDFPLPTGRSRLYVTGATAADAASVASQTGLENPAVNLVFLTDLHDTRFDVYSVLRPLSGAH